MRRADTIIKRTSKIVQSDKIKPSDLIQHYRTHVLIDFHIIYIERTFNIRIYPIEYDK